MAQENDEEGIMRFLLTSADIKNTSIHDALVDLLGKPIAEASALCIPTAAAVKASTSSECRWNTIPLTKMGSRMLAACDTTQTGNLAFGAVGSTRPPWQPCFIERQYPTHQPRARPPSRLD